MKKKLVFIIETIFTVIIVGLCVLIFAMSKGFHPSIAGYEVLRVITPSMEPELPLDTLILIKDVDKDDLKEGDIITIVQAQSEIKVKILRIPNNNVSVQEASTLYEILSE